MVQQLGARLSRVDVAFDDYDGEALNVHAMREAAMAGEFAEGGRPPRHRFLSDEGHDTGCTLYVGGKGHKELCVYEKGKQLGMKESRWTRAEVRLYGKHVELSVEILTNPLAYLLGSYSVLQRVLKGVCSRLRTIKRAVEATGTAWVRWMSRQVGPSIHLLQQAFGSEWAAFAEQHVAREGSPGRFRGIAKGNALSELLRSELSCPSSV
jgi:phage replication initiation protein